MISTVGEALEGAVRALQQHTDSPGTDAQLLLGETLGRSRTWILSHKESEISSDQQAQFEASLSVVLAGAALPHVLGWWEFYGRRFYLKPQVLIPRPETELMVEEALGRVDSPTRILDLGTGSGCIAVTLALELPEARICASDLSWSALQVARRNVKSHGVDQNVTLICANLVAPFTGPFDLVCANLPYIATDQLHGLTVAEREPIVALDGGTSGTELIYATLEGLPRILAPNGCALFEIDPDQAGDAAERARVSFPSSGLRIETDLAGQDRLLVIERD